MTSTNSIGGGSGSKFSFTSSGNDAFRDAVEVNPGRIISVLNNPLTTTPDGFSFTIPGVKEVRVGK